MHYYNFLLIDKYFIQEILARLTTTVMHANQLLPIDDPWLNAGNGVKVIFIYQFIY